MRTAFFRELQELARADDRIYLLTGDLGYSVVEPFMQEFPGRFVNVGVAEQNLTGIATGLDRKSTRLNSSHIQKSRMPSSA